MPRHTPHLSPRTLRKQLLVAESDLNRAQWMDDLKNIQSRIDSFQYHGTALQTISSVLLQMARWWTANKNASPDGPTPASPWLLRALQGSALLASLWQAFRSKSAPRPPNPTRPAQR